MKVRFFIALIGMMLGSTANAAIVSVTGPNSSAGTAPAIIAAPPHALDDIVTNTGMQGFNEAQAVLTTVAHAHDTGVIAAGTLVDSHMIFLNSQGSAGLSHRLVDWTFDGIILGVMSNQSGTLEAASTFELGNPLTNYTVTFPGSGPSAPFPARGMESNDSYLVLAGLKTIQVNMAVSEPGDWIRVVTANPVPLPAAIWLFGAALIGFIGYSRRVNVA